MSSRSRFGAFVAVAVAVIVVIAFGVTRFASSEPDGLDRVAIDNGFASDAESHALEGSPTAGYEVKGVDDHGLSTGLAGLLGVGVTFVLAAGLLVVVRRVRPRPT